MENGSDSITGKKMGGGVHLLILER